MEQTQKQININFWKWFESLSEAERLDFLDCSVVEAGNKAWEASKKQPISLLENHFPTEPGNYLMMRPEWSKKVDVAIVGNGHEEGTFWLTSRLTADQVITLNCLEKTTLFSDRIEFENP